MHHLSIFTSNGIFIPLDFDSTRLLIEKLEELLVIKKFKHNIEKEINFL
jgi:hypothetical protein